MVVAIIALLVAILLPSLSRAREQTRIVRCLANMSNLSKAVLTFAQDHAGHGQLIGQGILRSSPPEGWEGAPYIGSEPTWGNVDPTHTKYEYQTGYFGQAGTWLKPWPIAYARQLGYASLKRAENYFEQPATNIASSGYFLSRFGRLDVLLCPSDDRIVHNAWTPLENGAQRVFGAFSYAANEDVFGVTEPKDRWACWKDGMARPSGAGADRLRGRLEGIIRPSQVILFCDGGNESRPQLALQFFTYPDRQINGPYLENTQMDQLRAQSQRIPQFRHSSDGGVAGAFADGSGRYLKPVEWFMDQSTNTRVVKRYDARARVSPYEVGMLGAGQP